MPHRLASPPPPPETTWDELTNYGLEGRRDLLKDILLEYFVGQTSHVDRPRYNFYWSDYSVERPPTEEPPLHIDIFQSTFLSDFKKRSVDGRSWYWVAVIDGHNMFDRATWWRHQMETFSALLAIYAENSPVNSLHKGQFSLIWARINGWVNNDEAGDFRSHRAHCDVTVMSRDLINE